MKTSRHSPAFLCLSLVILCWAHGSDAYAQPFKLINSTSTSLTAFLTTVESAGQKMTFNSSWKLEPGESVEIALKNNSTPIDTMYFKLHTRFGECMWKTQLPKSQLRQVVIQPRDLPLIRKQSEFRTWTSKDGKFTCKAKLAQHFIEKNENQVQLLKEDGNLVTLNLAKLHAADARFVDSIESGENPIVWSVGGKFIHPHHLIEKDVTIIMRWQQYSGVYKRVEPELIYGPIFTGKIVESRVQSVPKTNSKGRTIKEKESQIKVNGQARVFLARLLGTKEQTVSIKDQWLTFRPIGIMETYIDITRAAIDSILVDGYVYVPTDHNKLVLGSTDFWNQLREKKPIRFLPKKNDDDVNVARGMIGFAVVLGALAVGASALGEPAGPPPIKHDFAIKGRTLPNTKVYYGAGIGTYNSTTSGPDGHYQIYSLIRPSAGSEYYLDIEVAGKRQRKWTGKLDPNGVNQRDLL